MKKIIIIFLGFICLFSKSVTAKDEIVTVQPKIMVIPYTKEGEDIRTVLESDVNKRLALTLVKEAFDKRGFTTVDFVAKLKAVGDNSAFTMENQKDLKSMIIEQSGADIYIEAELDVLKSETGTAVKLIVTGYAIATGNSLANTVGSTSKFYTDDIGTLAKKAVDDCIEGFLNTLQNKFTDIVQNGNSIIINFGIDATSTYTMHSPVGKDKLLLADELELWMEEHAYKNNYHIQGSSEKQMIFDDVRIPIRDPKTDNNYNSSKFGMEILKFFRGLDITIVREVKGNTLFITIK